MRGRETTRQKVRMVMQQTTTMRADPREFCHPTGADEDGQSDLLAEEGRPSVDLEYVLQDPGSEQDLVVTRSGRALDVSFASSTTYTLATGED